MSTTPPPPQDPLGSSAKKPVMVTTCSRRKVTRGLDTLEIEKVYGSGNYGVVYKVRDRSNHDAIVALKKIKTDRETQGFPITALREIKILNMLKHENIVDLREIVTCNIDENDPKARSYRDKGVFPGDVFMLFEFVDYDLSGLMKAKYELSPEMIRSYMHQLLSGIKFLHENRIIHRDLKCANILITSNHVLKIADWGLARMMPNQPQNMTVPVVTLWYRSPELILERRDYGREIDVWSAGCMFMELSTKEPLFSGGKEEVQLDNIFKLLGTPDTGLMERFKRYRDQSKTMQKVPLGEKNYQPRVRELYKARLSDLGFELFLRMIDMDPDRRISAEDALHHRYFTSSPITDPSNFGRITIEPITEHMANEERRKNRNPARDAAEVAPPVRQEYKTHDNTGQSRFNHREIIASDPALNQFQVVKKNKAPQNQIQQQPPGPSQVGNNLHLKPDDSQQHKRSRPN